MGHTHEIPSYTHLCTHRSDAIPLKVNIRRTDSGPNVKRNRVGLGLRLVAGYGGNGFGPGSAAAEHLLELQHQIGGYQREGVTDPDHGHHDVY
jgi:hypothetical protein